MARLRARFNVATDEEVEDVLMEYGVLRDSEPGDWVCAGGCLMALEPGRDGGVRPGNFTDCLQPLAAQVCSLQDKPSPFGFALPLRPVA